MLMAAQRRVDRTCMATKLRNWRLTAAAAALAFAVACQSADPPTPSQLAQCRAAKGAAPAASAEPGALPTGNEADWHPATCAAAALPAPACPSPTVTEFAADKAGAAHVALPAEITYAQSPPLSGPHRAEWAKWGEYSYLPPQRWLHNLEHGGVAFLVHPCAAPAVLEQLRGFARCRPADASGPFRWVMTPYAGLDRQWSVVAWQWRIAGDCFDAAAVEAFLAAHYNQSPENMPGNGSWSYGWRGL